MNTAAAAQGIGHSTDPVPFFFPAPGSLARSADQGTPSCREGEAINLTNNIKNVIISIEQMFEVII